MIKYVKNVWIVVNLARQQPLVKLVKIVLLKIQLIIPIAYVLQEQFYLKRNAKNAMLIARPAKMHQINVKLALIMQRGLKLLASANQDFI